MILTQGHNALELSRHSTLEMSWASRTRGHPGQKRLSLPRGTVPTQVLGLPQDLVPPVISARFQFVPLSVYSPKIQKVPAMPMLFLTTQL